MFSLLCFVWKHCLLTAQGWVTYAKNTFAVADNMRVFVCSCWHVNRHNVSTTCSRHIHYCSLLFTRAHVVSVSRHNVSTTCPRHTLLFTFVHTCTHIRHKVSITCSRDTLLFTFVHTCTHKRHKVSITCSQDTLLFTFVHTRTRCQRESSQCVKNLT